MELEASLGEAAPVAQRLAETATFALGGLVVMMVIFGTGYAVAYFFRKLWI